MATNAEDDLNSENKTETHALQSSIIDITADLPSPEICVICLDRISEKATALPCGHDNFDFPCLGTWAQHLQVCPLCKRDIRAIRIESKPHCCQIIPLPSPDSSVRNNRNLRPQHDLDTWPRRASRRRFQAQAIIKDNAVEFRKNIYQKRLYSLHVGANRISKYRNITPLSFIEDDHLVSRARMWIRRELNVFEFLNPDSETFGRADRRASNAEFLLEYIVAILKSIDIKSSTGQAEELLKDFLGRENTRLFLHELESWLRSPFENLDDWDRAVQYDEQSIPRRFPI